MPHPVRESIPPEDAALVMYSGGLDSTVAAIRMARRFRRVILLTVDLEHTINLRGAAKNVPALRRAFPDCRIEHRILDGDGVRSLVWKGFADDYHRFCKGRGAGIVCLGCKMAMMVQALRVCLEENVGHVTNGMTRSQIAHPHNLPRIVNRFGDFMAAYGVVYINDVYDMPDRGAEEDELARHGLGQGVRIGASSVTHQPRCFLGPPTKLWLMSGPAVEADMVAYFDAKRPVMRDCLRTWKAAQPGLEGRVELRTRVDESRMGEHTYEFSPAIDKAMGALLAPAWWAARAVLWLCGR